VQKLIITGGGGFVAGSVIAQAADFEVHALSGKPPLAARPGLIWHTLDLGRMDEVRMAIERICPDVLLHAAAIADIDFCENHPDMAQAINIDLTAAVAEACRNCRCRLLHISTDNVFDGDRGGYVEEDRPSPINAYARTKAAAEKIVVDLVPDSLIARVAIVMGFAQLGGGNSFLERTVPMLREGRPIYVPEEEIRTPIDVVTLGRALIELATADLQGFLHLAGNESLNRIELTCRLAQRLGFSTGLIRARTPEQIDGRAPRPRDISLKNTRTRSLLETPMRDFDSACDLILESCHRNAN
jgi:dTDP-4-dehydrorhamnose reductase